MAELHLSAVTRTQGANAALKAGAITPRGAVFDFVEVPVLPQGFRRMVRNLEFDVSEMAVTTYLVAKAHGVRFTALPVFLVRGFHHGALQVNRMAGVSGPGDLEGRRVGVSRGYTVTTGVWARGVLADEYGVDLDQVTWVLSGDEHVREYRPPANVVPMQPGEDLQGLLASGDVAAAIGAGADHPHVVPLIADAEEAGLRALRRDGFHPINHLVVVRDELLEAHPDLAESVFGAFAQAKRGYVERLRAGAITDPDATDRLNLAVMETTGADPLPYGLEPNRAALEKLLDLALAQHILDVRPDLDTLFAKGTHGLTA
jgi:4,5-dihydroxyphthalate decarboxylase